MITPDEFVAFIEKHLKNKKFIVALQSEPFQHVLTPDGIQVEKHAGGASELMNAVLKKVGGMMVAMARGNADAMVVDDKGRISMPPEDSKYILKRIFVTKEELDGWYFGFSNQTLWPLCHAVFQKPSFVKDWWEQYKKVNQKYAKAILEELGDEDEAFIWVHDYQLALLPRLLHEKKPKLAIGTFWHIPWPTYEFFRVCPWRKEIYEGLLGSDFFSCHRDYQIKNFVECVRNDLPVRVDTEPLSINYKDHDTKLVNLPAGIDSHEILERIEKEKNVTKNIIRKDFSIVTPLLAIGVDRIDYTKGLIERLQIIDRFLEKYPEFQKKFTYLSIAPMSRHKIPAFRNLQIEVFDYMERINWKYSTDGWQPIYIVDKTIDRDKVFTYLRVSDICMVTALDDGMNLVAKEYVLTCNEDKGMLLLSKFTGAAKDLSKAMLINPYDTEGSADALYAALTMSPEEKTKRNLQMREILKENNIYKWAMKFVRNTIQWNEDDE